VHALRFLQPRCDSLKEIYRTTVVPDAQFQELLSDDRPCVDNRRITMV
jgi:hypothetical protein